MKLDPTEPSAILGTLQASIYVSVVHEYRFWWVA